MNKEELIELIGKFPRYRSYYPDWNPIEEFLPFVGPKEICHSRILAQFLDPIGPHKDGAIYLCQFLYVNGINCTGEASGIEDAIVTCERGISFGRKIDIFIEWTDLSGERRAVIVENKLNGANYQPNQLEDYREAIEAEGYFDVKVIALHINESPQDYLIKADSVMYAWELAIHVFDYLLGEECIPSDYRHIGTIYPYQNYLLSLSIENHEMETAKQFLELDYSTLEQVAGIAHAYGKLNDAKNQWLLENIKQEVPNVCFQTGALDGDEQISFWTEDDYHRNGCWVCVHYPKDPVNDPDGTDIWLASDPQNKTQADEIANRLGFTYHKESKYNGSKNACWYCNNHGVDQFQFFNLHDRQQLLNTILKLLKALSA